MNFKAEWIYSKADLGSVCPTYEKEFFIKENVKCAKLYITAIGVYEANLNGKRVGDFFLAPGWTVYKKRLQYQCYDVTEMLAENNVISVTVANGWHRGRIYARENLKTEFLLDRPLAVLAQLEIEYITGEKEVVVSDTSWKAKKSKIAFSDIYDGEIYDSSIDVNETFETEKYVGPYNTLVAQEGEKVCTHERISPLSSFVTPNGDTVIDFGQNITGFVEFEILADGGEEIKVSFAEVLDKEGNFYTDNYRSAKSSFTVICENGFHKYYPHFTFFGFRYIRIESQKSTAKIQNTKAVAVYSDIKQTGYIKTSNPLLNKLFSNIIWGQKDNFLDVPTDCPQRDERLGWTGDAQVFMHAAAYNFNVKKFFIKWLNDMMAEQDENGAVGVNIPDISSLISAGWSDAATICPWTLYLFYGDKTLLEQHFPMMKKWVDYIYNHSGVEGPWESDSHFGDWLGLDAPVGSYLGSSRIDLISAAFYAYSTQLLIRAGKVLGYDMWEYENRYDNIVTNFRRKFPECNTQTECALALHFHLAENPQKTADKLVELIKKCGNHLQTGFLGTPYLLHALSDFGYSDIAWDLLLREEYPSWLYSVRMGATTIWEHWDGINDEGEFWDAEMNSFNHYAYGAVADWMYSVAGGIKTCEDKAGFEKIIVSPVPTDKLDFFSVEFETRLGIVKSSWEKQDSKWRFEITVPTDSEIVINNTSYECHKGTYIFYSENKNWSETRVNNI